MEELQELMAVAAHSQKVWQSLLLASVRGKLKDHHFDQLRHYQSKGDGSDENTRRVITLGEDDTLVQGVDVTVEVKGKVPEQPTTCCMTGCPNCVWLQYAEQLSDHYGKSSYEKAVEAIEREVVDPNLKAFLLMEVRLKFINK